MTNIYLLFTIFGLLQTTNSYYVGGGVQPAGSSNNFNTPIGSGSRIGNGVSPTGGQQYDPGSPSTSSGKSAGSYCQSDTECAAGLSCQASVNGVRICLAGSGTPTSSGGCTSSSSCGSNGVCVMRNGVGSCQVSVGGNVRGMSMIRYPSSVFGS